MKFRPAARLARILDVVRSNAESPVYLVGGSLRDAILKRSTTDLDLAVEGSAETLARRLARELKGTLVVLDEATRVYRVVLPRGSPYLPWTQLDIAQAQNKDIHADLLRRDFTINAMAWPLPGTSRKKYDLSRSAWRSYSPGKEGKVRGSVRLKTDELLDPRGGLRDLKRRIIRADLPSVFPKDPLRLLRAFRQAAQLDFNLDAATQRHIRTYRGLVRKPAGERIRHELLEILSSSRAETWLRRMDEAGLLAGLFPELEKCRRCAAVYYGRGGVLRHSLDTAARMDLLLLNLEGIFPDIAKEVRGHMAERTGSWERAQPLLRLAALLHDIAKPATARMIKGRLRFFGHDTLGAQKAAKLLGNLRFSRQETEFVSACIRHHLRPGNLAANLVISDKAAFRFFRDVGDCGVALLLVCWADHASYLSPSTLRRVLPHVGKDPHSFPLDRVRGGDVRKTLHHLQAVGYLLRSYFQRRERILPSALLDGHAIMKALKIPPGPAVGRALDLLREAQAEGKVSDQAKALEFLNKKKRLLDIGLKT